jgi:hypothetical protein
LIPVTVVAMTVPSSAGAVVLNYYGHVAGDTGSTATITFSASGKFTKKGRFIPASVSRFQATVPFTCFDAFGNVTSTITRNDLPFGSIGRIGVGKVGSFAKGTIVQDPYATYNVAGRLRKGRATGTIWAQQGAKNVGPACSTGGFEDPTTSWQARLTFPVCALSERRPLCDGPPRAP